MSVYPFIPRPYQSVDDGVPIPGQSTIRAPVYVVAKLLFALKYTIPLPVIVQLPLEAIEVHGRFVMQPFAVLMLIGVVAR